MGAMFEILFVDSVCFYVFEAKYIAATMSFLDSESSSHSGTTKYKAFHQISRDCNARNQRLDLNLMGKKKIKI